MSETQLTPLLSTSTGTSNSSSDTDESLVTSQRFILRDFKHQKPSKPLSRSYSYRSLAVLSGHIGSVCCIALCGEFILSASHGKDIIVWQQPDLRQFTKFGQGEGTVKAVVAVGNKVFTAHQDSRIRVWKVSRRSENVFRWIDTLPTTKDYLGKFMKQSNYIQTRRNHKKLWIEHADSISCLAVYKGFIYSGSWDKTLKVWRLSDLKCVESIKAHDDAINGLVASDGVVYTASADGKIKAWGSEGRKGGEMLHFLKGTMDCGEEVSLNCVVVSKNGRFVYGGSSDGFIVGWERDLEVDSWKLVSEVKAHEMAVLCMCVVGDFLCSGSADKGVGVWKIEGGGGLGRVGNLKGHEGPVKCLQASNCGGGGGGGGGGGFLVYSGSFDRSLRVWWVPKVVSSEGEEGSPKTESIKNP